MQPKQRTHRERSVEVDAEVEAGEAQAHAQRLALRRLQRRRGECLPVHWRQAAVVRCLHVMLALAQ